MNWNKLEVPAFWAPRIMKSGKTLDLLVASRNGETIFLNLILSALGTKFVMSFTIDIDKAVVKANSDVTNPGGI